jgi:hypothetical protein
LPEPRLASACGIDSPPTHPGALLPAHQDGSKCHRQESEAQEDGIPTEIRVQESPDEECRERHRGAHHSKREHRPATVGSEGLLHAQSQFSFTMEYTNGAKPRTRPLTKTYGPTGLYRRP